jgi:hypothetical protein
MTAYDGDQALAAAQRLQGLAWGGANEAEAATFARFVYSTRATACAIWSRSSMR